MKRLIFVLGASALILSACGGGGKEVTGAEEFGYQPLPTEETTVGAGAVAATVGAVETLAEETVAEETVAEETAAPEEPATEAPTAETYETGERYVQIGGGSDEWFHVPSDVTLDYHTDGSDYWSYEGTDASDIQNVSVSVGAGQDYVDVANNKADSITYTNGKSNPAVAYSYSIGGSTWYAVEVYDADFRSYQYVCFADDELRCISIAYKELKQMSEDEIQKTLESWVG